jgi:hypothetical protein
MTPETPPRQVTTSECNCYKCIGPVYGSDESKGRYIVNSIEHHTLAEPCAQCGRPKADYYDLGWTGRYVCYICHPAGGGACSLDVIATIPFP